MNNIDIALKNHIFMTNQQKITSKYRYTATQSFMSVASNDSKKNVGTIKKYFHDIELPGYRQLIQLYNHHERISNTQVPCQYGPHTILKLIKSRLL